MTRPSKNSLVLDGSQVKIRLQAERTAMRSVVHIDWVRFTVQRRLCPVPELDSLFPPPKTGNVHDETAHQQLVSIYLQSHEVDHGVSVQALELAQQAAECLGPDFQVCPEVRKGHDFYRFRFSIEREGHECGWVGFLASGDSPRQKAQSKTIHCNLFGMACTFAAPGWNHRLADMVEQHDAEITRADLALDFFDGLPGGLDGVVTDYKAGLLNSGGKRLKCNMVGDWANGQERSFYFGSKQAGKQTNVYEKGHQLFGVEAGNPWTRIELRYGNKLRVLETDILRRPTDFFAGASQWHADAVAQLDALCEPEPVKTASPLQIQTVQAEVTRVMRWAQNTAAPTMAVLFKHLGDEFLDFVTTTKLPGRLQKFSSAELGAAFNRASSIFNASDARPAPAMA